MQQIDRDSSTAEGKIAVSLLSLRAAPARTAGVFFFLAVLMAIAVVPAPGGAYGETWLFDTLWVYLELLVSLAALRVAFNHPVLRDASALRELGVGLSIIVAVQLLFAMLAYKLWPEVLAGHNNTWILSDEQWSWLFLVTMSFYGVWVLVFRYPRSAIRAALRTSEAERLRQAADQAELLARLSPHFLLNTLNGIAGLIGEDPKRARDVIANLGDLLRASLYPARATSAAQHCVDDELTLLRAYADIMKARFGDQIDIIWSFSAAAQARLFPRLLLQPLLENAILHGALKHHHDAPSHEDKGSTVSVSASVDNDGTLQCTIINDGTLVDDVLVDEKERGNHNGEGIDVVRRRLALLEPAGELKMWCHENRVHTRVSIFAPLKGTLGYGANHSSPRPRR